MTPAQAKDTLLRMVAAFPTLVGDAEINFNGNDLIEWFMEELNCGGVDPEVASWAKNGMPEDYECELPYVAAAKALHHRDGEVEIDASAEVSESEDGGAYVQSWVWVSDDDAKRYGELS